CLVTPSRLAISRQDQPCARALLTWSSSSTSTSPPSATTAAIPASGSGPAAASTNRLASPSSTHECRQADLTAGPRQHKSTRPLRAGTPGKPAFLAPGTAACRLLADPGIFSV